MTDKPEPMPIDLDSIPLELRQKLNWVVWRWEQRNGNWTKPPYQPSGRHARSNDPGTWTSFDEAVAAYSNGGDWDGLGFMLDADMCGFDWDDCLLPDGQLRPETKRWVERFDTYTEYSPSGKGLKSLALGKLPGNGHHNKFEDIEIGIFDNRRYFCITGNVYEGVSNKIEHRQDQLIELLKRYWPDDFGPQEKPRESSYRPIDGDPIDIAMRSNDEKFNRLWRGDIGDYPSHSEADQALCFKLAFYTGKDPGQIDTLFRESGLMRDKWNLENYRCRTINRAIELTQETYRPGLGRERDAWNGRQPDQDSNAREKESSSCAPTVNDLIRAAHDDQRGCANMFIYANQGRFCFDHAAVLWYRFDKHYWVLEDIGEPIRAIDFIQGMFKKVVAELGGNIVTAAHEKSNTTDATQQTRLDNRIKSLQTNEKTLKSIIKKLSNLNFRKQVVEFAAQGVGTLGINGSQWDQRPFSLACKDGIINLKTGKRQPGRPVDYIKSPCPTVYDPRAACPRFKQFLLEIFGGDENIVKFTQRVFGMGLIGSAFQKQYLVILSGQGRNGKDTLLSVVGDVLGQHLAGPIAPEMLLDTGKFGRRSSSGPSPDIMRLRGLRIAWASETSQGRRFDAGRAKMLTGGGSIVGRPPYGRHEIEFEQSHLIFLLTNHRPHAPIDDYAFWKRICNVPFTQSFVDDPQAPHEHKVDKDILPKLKAEAPGILRWMVEGCLAYQGEGLSPPQTVQSANEEYRRSEDTLQDFIDDECILHPAASCKSSRLYARYKDWASDGGIRPMSQTALGRQLSQRGFDKRKSDGKMVYEGIGLLAQGERTF